MRRKPKPGKIINLFCLGICLCMTFSGVTGWSQPRHYLFTALLSEHVAEDRVDYVQLCNDGRFLYYIEQLARTDPAELESPEAELAFWINTYNAYTLKIVCENYPLKSINQLHFGGLSLGTLLNKTVWDREFVVINEEKMSLNTIEHQILRKKFSEPRIHFAIVCAAKSCPRLRDEAYEADFIEYQLNDQGRIFLTDYRKNRFDTQNKIAFLSKIFHWFGRDFGKTPGAILRYLSQFLPKQIADSVGKDPNAWRMRYLPYDWTLNEVKQIK